MSGRLISGKEHHKIDIFESKTFRRPVIDNSKFGIWEFFYKGVWYPVLNYQIRIDLQNELSERLLEKTGYQGHIPHSELQKIKKQEQELQINLDSLPF